ncbi:MAG: hypothetical protein E5W69_06765 [Mesorhizobium sp.]|nr:MAG: hypothetical protein E5W69_06765 [Mesorhizobium sp.]
MDHIVRLDSRQEAALQATADKFIAQHKGDAVKALKEMIVLKGHLQDRLDKLLAPRRANIRRDDNGHYSPRR